MRHVACMGKVINVYKIFIRKQREHLGDISTEGRTILKLILQK